MRHPDFFPVGAVMAYAGQLADTDKGAGVNLQQIRSRLARDGWLFCDGTVLPCHAFRELYGVIGTAFGGDTGKTFHLPDLRGRFIRGVDGGSGHDPDVSAEKRVASGTKGNTGNQVGSLQTDAFQGHEHNYTAMMEAPDTAQTGPGITPYIPNPVPVATTDMEEESGDGTPRVSTETRPVNLYLNYIIRYRQF